jgi:hypothetical protein
MNIPPASGILITNGLPAPPAPVLNQRMMAAVQMALNQAFTRPRGARTLPDGRRDIDAECGHPQQPVDPVVYQDLFDRDAIASRVVKIFPRECWQGQPGVYEDEAADTQSAFEQAWDALGMSLRGEKSKYQDEEGSPLWEYLCRADVLSGIGRYGVILLGLDDGKELSEPVDGVQELGTMPVGKGEPRPAGAQRYKFNNNAAAKTKKLLYVRVFPESLAPVTRWEANEGSPRFGQPVMYQITFNDPRNMTAGEGQNTGSRAVHWTRVIHVADGLESSEWLGTPRMQHVLNRILDLKKLYGGSAEMYWLGALPGISFETDLANGGQTNIDWASVKDSVEGYINGLKRYMGLDGVTAKTLSPQVVDPGAQIEAQLDAICIEIDVPKRIFVGSERGQLASSQDERAWRNRVKARQAYYITPRIIAPFVDRLVMFGVLPEPKGYSVEWPDNNTQTGQEKATVAVTRATAIDLYTKGASSSIMAPMDFYTREMGYDEEEATAILEAATEHADEQQAQEMQQQADQAALQQERGLLGDGAQPAAQGNGQPVNGVSVGG